MRALGPRPGGPGGVWGLVLGVLGPSEAACVGAVGPKARLYAVPAIPNFENTDFPCFENSKTTISCLRSPVNTEDAYYLSCAKEAASAASNALKTVLWFETLQSFRCPPNAPSFTSCGSYDHLWSPYSYYRCSLSLYLAMVAALRHGLDRFFSDSLSATLWLTEGAVDHADASHVLYRSHSEC